MLRIFIDPKRSKITHERSIFIKLQSLPCTKNMEANPTLLCIPDISGFTRFMGEIDFELSAKVIPSLLNNIVYSNEIDLKISEIEGDAVLFFRVGRLPTLRALVDQCKHFYTEFYKQMDILRKKNNGHEAARKIPEMLGLKIILHFGAEIGLVPIGKNIKLMGEDVIVAHRLMKNEIPIDEYILITEDLLANFHDVEKTDLLEWADMNSGAINVDHLGKVNFRYIDLRPLQPKM